jgi:aminobenzoyl-glutamate utilization protein B
MPAQHGRIPRPGREQRTAIAVLCSLPARKLWESAVRLWLALLILLTLPSTLLAAPAPDRAQRAVLAAVDRRAVELDDLSRQLWEFAEVALAERRSAALLADYLEKQGFRVERGVARMPTAFVATAGTGKPVIGILAEYDALPALSQTAGTAEQKPVTEGAPGHGCAHNLLGAGAVGAAVALADVLRSEKLAGTVVLYGCPAEETLLGKTVMARDGLFDRLDVAFTWHPGTHTLVNENATMAIKALQVEFFGRTAHAASSPWEGRGALDGLEIMEHAVALMREHIRPTARLHRIVEVGGQVFNVISDYARARYGVRDATMESVDEMVGRVERIAAGAALASETRAKVTPLFGARESWYAPALQEVMRRALEVAGPPGFDTADQALAKSLQTALGKPETGVRNGVDPREPPDLLLGSTDVAEVCAVVPLAHLSVACRPEGLPNHHWNVTACAGSAIGRKGALTAARALALTGLEVARRPEVSKQAKAELRRRTAGRPYRPPVPDDVLDANLR